REVLPRDGAAPGVGARPAVGEDPAREREARLVLGLKLGERLHALLVEEALWQVELGLDVRLAAAGPDVGRVAFRAEQQADRLREDRLARAGLPGDRGQPARRLELGLPDQDEVVDAQAAKHSEDGIRTTGSAPSALTATGTAQEMKVSR